MNDFITRKQESYLRAMQGFHRVLRDRGLRGGGGRLSSRGGASDYGYHSRSGAYENSSQGDQEEAEPTRPVGGQPEPEGDQRNQEWTWRGANTWGSWWSSSPWTTGWDWSGYGSGNAWSGPYGSGWSGRSSWQPGGQENLLPSFIQGWYLLQDAGLDTRSRNAVITALRGNFEVEQVAQELRNQWTEADLKRHDASSRHTSYVAGLEEDGEEEMETISEDDNPPGGLNDEGLAILAASEEEIQDALAAINNGKRTLKEARARQNQGRSPRTDGLLLGTTPFALES